MESDEQFMERMEDTKRELGTLETDDWPRLFDLARRGAAMKQTRVLHSTDEDGNHVVETCFEHRARTVTPPPSGEPSDE